MSDYKNNQNNNYFSVIICCYNSERFIESAVNSVINQSYVNWEIILIDDGSKDQTNEVLKKYSDFDKIKIYSQKNQGLGSARNLATKKSNYEWIVILDHDDKMKNNRLEELNRLIQINSTCKLFFSDAIFFEEEKFLYTRFEISRKKDKFLPYDLILKKKYGYYNLIKYGCFIVSSTVAFSKSEAISVGLFDNKFKFIVDYIFFLNFSKKYNMYCSNSVLSEIRVHQKQSTNILKKTYFKELSKLYTSLYFNKFIKNKLKIAIIYKHLRLFYSYYLKK